jgi:putative pyruvate formate lyase activating enzyme
MMVTAAAPRDPRLTSGRSRWAKERLPAARAALIECRLCAHACGVNRLEGATGRCHAGAVARVFSAQTEVSDELELIPTFAIAFSGCDLRCDFCITGRESWNARAGAPVAPDSLAESARAALEQGARTIMFLGGEPTIHLATVLEVVACLPDEATLVWKTNAHGTAMARSLLEGIFDIWVADYKFGNDDCAARLAGVPGYQGVVRENLRWAARHSRLIVRHLLMPGHVACCWAPVAGWLARELPTVEVNLRVGFWPAWQSKRHPELGGTVTAEEARRAWAIADECNLRVIP